MASKKTRSRFLLRMNEAIFVYLGVVLRETMKVSLTVPFRVLSVGKNN